MNEEITLWKLLSGNFVTKPENLCALAYKIIKCDWETNGIKQQVGSRVRASSCAVYIYIYIYRERERERESCKPKDMYVK
jgi:hypothetical protein